MQQVSKIGASLVFFVGIAYASLFSFGVIDNIRGPFYPDVLQDLSLNSTTGSLYFALCSLMSFLLSLSGQILIKRFRTIQLLAIACFSLALSFVGLGFSANLFFLLVSAMLLGVAFGILNFAQNLLVQEAAPLHLRRRLYSGLHAMYGLSSLVAPLLANLFRDMGLSWRHTFVIVAALPFLVGLSCLPKLRARAIVHEDGHNPRLTWAETKMALLFSVIIACYLFGELAVSTRMVQWLRADRMFSPEEANLYLALFFCLLLIGRLIFTFIHFSHSNEIVLRISAGVSVVLYTLGLWGSPIWMALTGLSMAPFFPVAMDHVAHIFGKKGSSGLAFILGLGSLSICILHIVLGVLTDWVGLTQALLVGPAALSLIVLLLWPWFLGSHRVTVNPSP